MLPKHHKANRGKGDLEACEMNRTTYQKRPSGLSIVRNYISSSEAELLISKILPL